MDSNVEAHTIHMACQMLHAKYGYSKKECMAYIKGVKDYQSFMNEYEDSVLTLNDNIDSEIEYYEIEIPDVNIGK